MTCDGCRALRKFIKGEGEMEMRMEGHTVLDGVRGRHGRRDILCLG